MCPSQRFHHLIFPCLLMKRMVLPLTKKLCFKTIHSFSYPTSIYLFKFSINNNRIKCEIYSKLRTEAPDVVLVFLLLILNILDTFLVIFFVEFEHLNAEWNT